MSKTLSAKYYQENKVHEIFLKNKKKKSEKMIANLTKISQKMKNKSLLSIEKNVMQCEKMCCYNYKKLF